MTTGGFSFASGNLAKIVVLPKYLLSALFSWFVPRRPGRWVFGSWIGVGEGALAVARELKRRDPDARITWIVANEKEARTATAEGFMPVRRRSWLGYWETLTAHRVVITHGFGDVNRYGIVGARIVHLGHGVPIKRLHHHVARITDGPGFVKSILRRAYRVGAERVELYVASSVTVADRLRTANRVAPGRVRALGDPRDDAVIEQGRDRALAEAARAEVRDLLDLPVEAAAPEPLILYAPTWRDGEADPAVPAPEEIEQLRAGLSALGARLVIRSHPLGHGAYDAVIGDRVHELPAVIAPDITPLLGAFDAVVSDYSSIVIDYALLGRPILWFAPDLSDYSASRGLYEPLELTAAGRVLGSWSQVLDQLGQVLTPGARRSAAEADARALAARFHAHPEGGAAGRVLDELQRLDLPAAERVAEGVFFESYEGRQVSCNPLAIDREIAVRFPEVQRYWSVTSERTEVPEGAVPLLVGGADWLAARRRARLIVVNDWLRFGFKRAAGQTVLQTWHGTMLKHLALTRPGSGLQTQIAVRRESRRWSLMLSQNPHSTEQFRRSYDFRGEIIEQGYPRDDRLARALVDSADGPERIGFVVQAARRALGVPEGPRVLAYVPTWRESSRGQASGRVDLLDVRELAAGLGDEWVVVVRGHTRTHAFGGYLGGGEGTVIDASRHPDVNNVILAADLIVTDYSSVMFDAAVARVPMLFFVPDLALYRDRERGFTFDFEREAPGPLLATRDEVVRHAQELGSHGGEASWALEHRAAYEAWCERFTPHDDGEAAARVVDALVQRGALG